MHTFSTHGQAPTERNSRRLLQSQWPDSYVNLRLQALLFSEEAYGCVKMKAEIVGEVGMVANIFETMAWEQFR
jgi:hypothetical protein